jgi:hypothetical protein
MCHKWPQICSTCRKHLHILSSFITYQRFVTRVTLWVLQVEKELLTLPEQQSSPPVFSWFRVAQSQVFCVAFCRSLFVLLSFFFWSLCWLSSINRLWLPLWYLQTILINTCYLWYCKTNTFSVDFRACDDIYIPLYCFISQIDVYTNGYS